MESAAVTGQLLKGRGTAAGTSRHLFVEAWMRNDDRFKRWGLRVRSLTCRQAKLSAGVVAVCKPPTLGGGGGRPPERVWHPGLGARLLTNVGGGGENPKGSWDVRQASPRLTDNWILMKLRDICTIPYRHEIFTGTARATTTCATYCTHIMCQCSTPLLTPTYSVEYLDDQVCVRLAGWFPHLYYSSTGFACICMTNRTASA